MRKKVSAMILILLLMCLVFIVSQYAASRNPHRMMVEPVFTEAGISVYQTGTSYLVLTEYRGKATGMLEFTDERTLVKHEEILPPEITDIRILLGKTLEDVECEYGNYHVNTGSGFFIPSYITMDGYLVKMWIEDGVVAHVSKIDLFSGTGTEWYALDSIASQ